MENVNTSKVIRVGNSLAVVIPVAIRKGLKIEKGDRVVLAAYDENIFAVRKITAGELRSLKPGEVPF